MYNVENRSNNTLKLSQCYKIFKVCLAIFQDYTGKNYTKQVNISLFYL